ncbi:MAG: site-specific integrase [Candidatus Competibacter denitrificans]
MWWVQFTGPSGERVHQSTKTSDKRSAQEWHDSLRDRLWRESRMGDKPKKLWNDAVVQWLTETTHKATHEEDIAKLRWLDQFWRGWPLERITRAEVQRIGAIKAKEASPATANRYLALIRSILTRAHKVWEWLDRAPAVTLYPEPKRRVRWLTHEEADRLLAALPSHLADMARFALATGLRESNVTGLLWSQIDLKRGHAWIHPDQAKARKSIAVPLNADALAVVRAQIGKHEEYVFTYRGRPVTRTTDSAWYKAIKRCGFEDFRWHDLRHTWASWHVQSGTPLQRLMELGGWANYEMVLKYAHLAPGDLVEEARRIERIPAQPNLRIVK